MKSRALRTQIDRLTTSFARQVLAAVLADYGPRVEALGLRAESVRATPTPQTRRSRAPSKVSPRKAPRRAPPASPQAELALHSLSPRQREVFDLAARNVPNRAIAQTLGVSLKTVQTHRAKINPKLGVHSASQLVLFAIRHGVALGGTIPGKNRIEALSSREREVFDLVSQGEPNQRIAVRLRISLKTVQTHRAHVNAKLGVHSSGQLIRLAASLKQRPKATTAEAGAHGAAGETSEWTARRTAGDVAAPSRPEESRVAAPPLPCAPADVPIVAAADVGVEHDVLDPLALLGGIALAPPRPETEPAPARRVHIQRAARPRVRSRPRVSAAIAPPPTPTPLRPFLARPGEEVLLTSPSVGVVLRRAARA